RGYRIELAEIEAALMRDAAVADALAMVRDDEAGGQRLVAYIVARDGTVAGSDLRGRLRDRLPDHMVPSTFVPVDTIPLTPSGQVDRDALPEPDERPAIETYAAPQTA